MRRNLLRSQLSAESNRKFPSRLIEADCKRRGYREGIELLNILSNGISHYGSSARNVDDDDDADARRTRETLANGIPAGEKLQSAEF